jgi:EmrB/QacA subfamily drug resistance transporter
MLRIVLTGTFMALLDLSIVNVAIPSIRNNLGASFAEIQFVIAGYAAAFAVMLITGGRLGDLFGHRRVFMTGMAGFTIASALCGLSPNAVTLVAARVLQGFMAALMYPQVISVIQVSFPQRERGRAFGIFGVTIGLGIVMGPILGGLLIRNDVTGSSWRLVFLVNVPVGIVSLLATTRLLREWRSPNAKRLDIPGVALASTALFMIIYPLIEGQEVDWASWTYLSMGAGVVVFAIFLLYEARISGGTRSPLIELSMFRDRAFSIGTVVTFIYFSAIRSFFFVLSLFLQIGLAYSPMVAGLIIVPLAIGFACGSLLSVRLVPRLGTRVLLGGYFLAGPAILGLISVLHWEGPNLRAWQISAFLVIFGLGVSSVGVPLINIVLATVRRSDAGSASGVFTTMQQLGGAIGVAVMGVIFFGLLGSSANSAAGGVSGDLRQELTALQPDAQSAIIDRQVATFSRCFTTLARAKDPNVPIPGCPVRNTQSPSDPVSTALLQAENRALSIDYTQALQRSILYLPAAYGVSLFLVLALPRTTSLQRAPRLADTAIAAD